MENQVSIAEIIDLAGRRAVNVFEARGLCCAESVILVMNQAFRGELTENMAIRLGSGFCHGMGGAGCVCGSLAGAEIALSLFLSPRRDGGMKTKAFERLAKELHDRFRARFSATCCRALLKRRKEKNGASCKELTRGGAEIVAQLLLENCPGLAGEADLVYLRTKESRVGGLMKKLLG